MANINKIRLSGQTYNIQDPNAQPLLTAGQGISIENNVISATGGGGSVDQTIISGSTNAVAGGAVYTNFDGLKLKKITQSAYEALSPNYDSNTLYIING